MKERRNQSFKGTKYQGKALKKLTELYLQAEGKEDPVEKMLKMYRKNIPRGVPRLLLE